MVDIQIDEPVGFDKREIAILAADQINSFTEGELLQVVRTVADTFGQDQPFETMDRKTLVTLAFLARRCCQNMGEMCEAI